MLAQPDGLDGAILHGVVKPALLHFQQSAYVIGGEQVEIPVGAMRWIWSSFRKPFVFAPRDGAGHSPVGQGSRFPCAPVAEPGQAARRVRGELRVRQMWCGGVRQQTNMLQG